MDPIRRIASLGSQLSSSFANRAPHRDAAPFLYPICSPLFYAYIVGVWIPAAFIKCRIPRSGALFEGQTGCEKGKNNIQNLVRRFVGFVNHQAGAFLLPGEFKRGVFNLLLEMYDCAPGFIGTAKKGTRFFIRFAE